MADAARPDGDLEGIAQAALAVGRVLMQCGARAHVVRTGCALAARELGAEQVDTRASYSAIDITVRLGDRSVTRMGAIGAIGVNHRLDQAVRRLARHAGEMTPAALLTELGRLERETPRHPAWLVAIAVGLACAAFGKLIGIDWTAFPAVTAAAACGQYVRHLLIHRAVNVFIVAVVVAFVAASLGALGAEALGSGTAYTAMIASILLLVPGVPALNAQSDIIEGDPMLGSARAVTVAMLLIFVVAGVVMAQLLVGVQP
ncbi:threonine/serine exporter family protein [Polymorphobacter sp.]|uniref:threonine/serine exporter family protein n=1 Tax=Polymorphobacter sp. TaxID=1909290 RepID=UPI003F7104BE